MGQQFGEARAQKDLAAYLSSGPSSTTRGLVEGLRAAGGLHGSVIDIGSGVGALALELLDAGASSAICVDLSAAFLDVARAEAARRGFLDRISWHEGDFVTLAPSLPPADVVVLDRVVCCYRGFESLLTLAATHSGRFVAFSYPRDRWYVRVMFHAGNLLRRVRRNAFTAFVHPPATMERLVLAQGFARVSRRESAVWRVAVYRRCAPPDPGGP
ncbi:MAG: class I SAM-dependent methyltransferase [Gemmatimonadales bacterium]